MSRTVGKAIHTVKEIWEAYAAQILKENPDWWQRTKYGFKVKPYRIGYYNGAEMIEVMGYPKFRKLVEQYFDRAKLAIIKGECINLGSLVGKVCIKRVQRDFRNKKHKKINWKLTHAQPKVWSEEKQKMVAAKIIYYTDDEWFTICWLKTGKVRNDRLYEFKPTKASSTGLTGFKKEFTEAQRKDPLLKYQYLYNPIQPVMQ